MEGVANLLRDHIAVNPSEVIIPYCMFRGEKKNPSIIGKLAQFQDNAVLYAYLLNERGDLDRDCDLYVFPPHMAETLGFAFAISKKIPEYKELFMADEAAMGMLKIWKSEDDTLSKLYATADLYGDLAKKGRKLTDSIVNLVPKGYKEAIRSPDYDERVLGRLARLFLNRSGAGRLKDYSEIDCVKLEITLPNYIFPMDFSTLDKGLFCLEEARGKKSLWGVDSNEVIASTSALVKGINQLEWKNISNIS